MNNTKNYLTLESIREQRADIAAKIDSALSWIFLRPWSKDIDFIILYGSVSRNLARFNSDIDLVIGMKENPDDLIRISKEIILNRPSEDLDIRLFDHLPVYIQKDALKGIILYCKDLSELHDLAYDTIKKYQAFKPYLDDYTGAALLL